MEIKPDQSTVGEVVSDVEEVAAVVDPVAAPKKVRKTAAKAVPARKTASKPASGSKPKAKPRKRPRQAAKPVAPPPPPLTLQELKEQGVQAKRELVNAVIEPALEAAGSLSQTIRDTIGGAFAGLLSRKRRD